MSYFVSRQSQWPEGTLCVEINSGGTDHANPGMLVEKYPGEGREYDNPVEAVEAGIKIARWWQDDRPAETILIAHGATGGYTMPFEGEELNDETFAGLRAWAAGVYEKFPACDQCGKKMPGGPECTNHENDEQFCGSYCAEERERFLWKDGIEQRVEGLDEDECRKILIAHDYELDETDTVESMRKLIQEDVESGDMEEVVLRG